MTNTKESAQLILLTLLFDIHQPSRHNWSILKKKNKKKSRPTVLKQEWTSEKHYWLWYLLATHYNILNADFHNNKGTSDQHSVKEGPYTSRQVLSVSLFSRHVLCVETNGYSLSLTPLNWLVMPWLVFVPELN